MWPSPPTPTAERESNYAAPIRTGCDRRSSDTVGNSALLTSACLIRANFPAGTVRAMTDGWQVAEAIGVVVGLPAGRVRSSSSRSCCRVISCTGFSMATTVAASPSEEGCSSAGASGAGIAALEGTPFVLRRGAPHAKILPRLDGPFQAGLNHLAATAYGLRLFDLLQESGAGVPNREHRRTAPDLHPDMQRDCAK